MRKILFRGKSIHGGGWYEGSLVEFDGRSFIFPQNEINWDRWVNYTEFEVRPETVGECMGLVDRDGRWIFEGDILENPLRALANPNRVFVIARDIRRSSSMIFYSANYVIAGNIWDDPELLAKYEEE